MHEKIGFCSTTEEGEGLLPENDFPNPIIHTVMYMFPRNVQISTSMFNAQISHFSMNDIQIFSISFLLFLGSAYLYLLVFTATSSS